MGLALVAMACASPCIIFQGYLLRSLLAMSANFGCPGWSHTVPVQWPRSRAVDRVVDLATSCPS